MRRSAGRSPARSRDSRCRMRKLKSAAAARCPATSRMRGLQGERARREVGRLAYEINVQQYACAGLNFGTYYDRSPIIAYDGAEHPAYTMDSYTPSTVPGCRTPHFWRDDGSSLYDAMGPEFTLLRFDSVGRHRAASGGGAAQGRAADGARCGGIRGPRPLRPQAGAVAARPARRLARRRVAVRSAGADRSRARGDRLKSRRTAINRPASSASLRRRSIPSRTPAGAARSGP